MITDIEKGALPRSKIFKGRMRGRERMIGNGTRCRRERRRATSCSLAVARQPR
jgi:hypothetical protein